MDWKLHTMIAFLLYFLIISFFNFSLIYSIQAIVILIFSSLFPDIDHPKSIIRKIVFIIAFYLMILFVVIEMNADVWMKTIVMFIILILTYYMYRHLPLRHRGKRSLHLWRYPFILSGIFFSFSIFCRFK